ncbi:MAG: hypothetical protein AB1724_15735 [Thermodesulfobacteriota bacterium]
MKPTNKKVLLFSSGAILIVAFFVWYFFPIIFFQWYCYKFDFFHKYLCLTPVYISELKMPLEKWEDVTIEKLSMKLPLSEYNEVSEGKHSVQFKSEKGPVHFLNFFVAEELKNPILSFQRRLKMLESSPDDISFFHSRKKNMTAVEYQISKTMSVPSGGLRKILSVQIGDLRALCLLFEKRDNGYGAHMTLYDQNGIETFSLILLNYKDAISLEADLLSILGGIKAPYFLNDMNKISDDISSLVKRLKKT